MHPAFGQRLEGRVSGGVEEGHQGRGGKETQRGDSHAEHGGSGSGHAVGVRCRGRSPGRRPWLTRGWVPLEIPLKIPSMTKARLATMLYAATPGFRPGGGSGD